MKYVRNSRVWRTDLADFGPSIKLVIKGRAKKENVRMNMKRMAGFAVLVMLMSVSVAQAENELSISGFVDTHYGKTLKGGMPVLGGDAPASNNSGSFYLDAVVVYLDKPIGDKYRVFADLGFYNDGGATVDQAFAEGVFLDEVLTVTFGKFDAPIGFEGVDAPTLYQFSHSIVYANMIPAFHVGVMGNIVFSDMLNLAVYLTNGNDVDGEDNNKEKGAGARLGVTTDMVSGGLSFVIDNPTGGDAYNDEASQTIIDVDVAVTPSDTLVIGGEFNMNTLDDGDNDVTHTGIMAMGHLDFMTSDSYTLGATLRGGFITWEKALGGEDVTQTEITAALTGVLHDEGATFVVEYRMDDWDSDGLPDDADDTDTHTFVLEFVFLF